MKSYKEDTMVKVLFIFAAVLVHIVCGAGPFTTAKSSGVPVPRIPLNLDLPPEDRWEPVLKHWDLNQLRKAIRETYQTYVPLEAELLVTMIGEAVDELLPQPYSQEIRGIAKTLGMSVGEITCLNIIYDVTAFCTSIVAQDSNGTIWHGRNLDYSDITILKNITAIIDFQSGGKTLYTATSFVTQVGVFTGMKPHQFTLSINERDMGTREENLFQMLQALLQQKINFTSFLIRDALAYDNSFEDVLKRVVPEQQVSPVYIIVGGVKPGEGAVVTRERTYTLDVWRLDAPNGRWFLLETNYDRWTPPPASDDRRDPGNKAMQAVGQSRIDGATMWNVLSTPPVLNQNTVYTAMMCAAKPDIYSSKIRSVP